jgi:hypothetical protein
LLKNSREEGGDLSSLILRPVKFNGETGQSGGFRVVWAGFSPATAGPFVLAPLRVKTQKEPSEVAGDVFFRQESVDGLFQRGAFFSFAA